MKVLYLIDTLEVGGSEKSLLDILARFRQTQPVVCHLYPGRTLKAAYEQFGIPVISLEIGGKYSFGQATRRVIEIVRREEPDLIHTTLFRSDVVGRVAGKRTGVPVISSFINDLYAPIRWRHLSLPGRFKLAGVQLVDALTANWACHFIANSEAIKCSNCRALRIRPEKVSVIYRGRDPEHISKVRPPRVAELRSVLGLPASGSVLLNVARLLYRKGQEDLIHAIPLVLEDCPDVRVLLAGDGPHRARLESLVYDLGLRQVVRLLGLRDDIPALLHLADLFVLPSHYEGFPGALVEAMLAARPILATDIPVHREAITPGETGCLVPVQDPESLAHTIVWMLRRPDETERMSKRAQEVASEKFHIQQIAVQCEELYAATLKMRDTKLD